MKIYKPAVYITLVLVPVLLFSCTNPYMVHNLERPVYLTGIEVRSDILTAEEPSHSLDQIFQEKWTSYTVTVPFNTKKIFLNGIPEAGAWVSGDTVRSRPWRMSSHSRTRRLRRQARASRREAA